jgi:hypothetical protein
MKQGTGRNAEGGPLMIYEYDGGGNIDANPIHRVGNKVGVSQCRTLWARAPCSGERPCPPSKR